jgi:hypothetical protein
MNGDSFVSLRLSVLSPVRALLWARAQGGWPQWPNPPAPPGDRTVTRHGLRGP